MKDRSSATQLASDLEYLRTRLSEAETALRGRDESIDALTALPKQKNNEKIVASERLGKSILEQAAEVIIVCDEQGRIIRVSQAARQLCDGSPLFKLFADVFPLRTDAAEPFHLAPVLRGKTLRHVEVALDRQSQKLDFILNAGPLLEDQQVLGYVVILTDITERKRAVPKQRAGEVRYLRQRNALIALTDGGAGKGKDLTATIRRLTETDAKTLGVARVSIWRYSHDRTAIRCVDLYELESNRHSGGMELSASAYPAYFQALAEMDVIASDDAHRDARTCEFSENYLRPLGINSMLDAPIHLGGTVDGVLCHEHVGPLRHWTADEEAFAVAVANLASVALEGSERRLAEAKLSESAIRYETLVDHAPVAVLVNRGDRVVLANAACLRLFGAAVPEQLLGKSTFALFDPYFHPLLREHIHQHRNDGNTLLSSQGKIVRLDGTLVDVEVTAAPFQDQGVNAIHLVLSDITERKRSEETMLRAISALKALSTCNMALVHASDEETLLNEICRIIVVIAGYRLAWVGFAEDDPEKTVRLVAHAGYIEPAMEQAEITWDDTGSAQGPVGTAIRTREPQLVQDAHSDPRYEPWRDSAIKIGYRSVLCLPLTSAGPAIGALCIYAAPPDAFDDQEIRLLSGLANELAFGIATLRARAEHHQSAERLRRGMESTIEALAGTLELRDAYTAGHQRRVAELATEIARELRIAENEIHGIHLAATVHDLGKIQVPAEILTKPTRLTNLEFEFVKTHAQAGYDLLKDIDFPWPIAQLVYQHHERIDGSGYPRGLRGKDILTGAKIIAVADTIEAMSSHRPYRAGLGIEAALAEITKNRDKYYDAAVVDACVKLFREKRFAFST